MDIPSNLTMGFSTSLWLAVESLTIVFYAGFAAFVYLRRPPSPLWPVLFWLQVAAVSWAGGDLLAILSPDVAAKSAALMVLYTGSIPMAALWWLTALRFAEANHVAFSWGGSRWAVYGPVAFAAVMWLCFVTNPWHGQFIEPVVGARQIHHWMFWLTSGVNQALGLATAGLYFALARREGITDRLREQTDILLAAAIAMPLANFIDALVPEIWPVDLSIAAGSVIGGLYLYGIYQSNLFDLAPVTLEQIVQADPSGVVITDRSLRVCFANEAARRLLPGVPLESGVLLPEALSTHLVAYRDPQTRSRWGPAFDEASGLDHGRLYRFESDSPGTHGAAGWLWIGTSTLPGCAHTRGMRCVRVQDVTELIELSNQRRELSDRLERSERLESLGVLAGGIAQELVEPLDAVRNGAERALWLARSEGELEDELRRVAEEARRGSDIASQMLRFASDGALDREVDDLNRHVASGCARAAESVRHWGAAVTLSLSRRPLWVRCEPGEIEQLVVHLLQNAAQACGRGGEIELRTELGERDAWIVVADDGPGMEEAVRLRAFEPFYTTRRSDGASGLGLSVVYGIACAHGGQVEVRSKPGLGCTVEVRLPLAVQSLAPAHRGSRRAPPSEA